MRRSFFALLLTASGCGQIAAVPSDVPTDFATDAGTVPPHDAATAEGATATSRTFGKVHIQLTTQITDFGQPTRTFGAQLFPLSSVLARCAAATTTVGSCCYVPNLPSALPHDMVNAGTLSLLDATTSRRVATLEYGQSHASFAGMAYPEDIFSDASVWSPGDLMTIAATGHDVGPFEVSVRALALPSTSAPPSIRRGEDLTFAWASDPNAETMTLTVDVFATSKHPAGTVVCQAPDSAQTLTVGASLTGGLASGDTGYVTLTRSADVLVQTATGGLTVASEAVYSAPVSVL